MHLVPGCNARVNAFPYSVLLQQHRFTNPSTPVPYLNLRRIVLSVSECLRALKIHSCRCMDSALTAAMYADSVCVASPLKRRLGRGGCFREP